MYYVQDYWDKKIEKRTMRKRIANKILRTIGGVILVSTLFFGYLYLTCLFVGA